MPRPTNDLGIVAGSRTAYGDGYSRFSASALLPNVFDWGAYGDGSRSDIQAFRDALREGQRQRKPVLVPDTPSGYVIDATLSVPAGTGLVGDAKHGTRLIHAANGYMFDWGGQTRFENLYIDGNGAAFTGRGVFIAAGNGQFTVKNCKIVDFADYCIDFAHEQAGSLTYWEDLETYQLVGAAVGEEAIIIRGALIATAQSRKFVGVETLNKRFIDLGPCNNLFIVGGRPGDILWNVNSRNVAVTGARIAGTTTPMVVLGADHTITGCIISPQVEAGAGLQRTSIKGNSYNVLPIINTAADPTNEIEGYDSIGAPAALGAGNNNDYALPANTNTPTLRLTSNGAGSVLTGIAGGSHGRRVRILHIAGLTLTINHQDVASAAANRIITNDGAAKALTIDGTAELVYDGTTQRWRLFSFLL